MVKVEREYKIPMMCHHCGHEWYYAGNSDKYCTCPSCHYKVNISKHRLDDEERTPEEEENFDLKKGEMKELSDGLEVERTKFTGKYWIRKENVHKDVTKTEWNELQETAEKEDIPFKDLLNQVIEDSDRPLSITIKRVKAHGLQKLDSFQQV